MSAWFTPLALILAGWPAGSAGDWQSVLNPQSSGAHDLLRLFWLFTAVCTVVWVLVALSLLVVLFRRRRGDDSPELEDPAHGRRTAIVTALTLATVVILAIFTLASFYATRELIFPSPNPLQVKVTGNQWWWDVEYRNADPSQIFTTANEIHIPVGRAVALDLAATDVIHSFWAPNLMGKQDLIPGRQNSLTIKADHPGVYRGQCAEFCGLQHAHMGFLVIAEPPAVFEAWRQAQIKPAPSPANGQQALGEQVFVNGACATCHTITGTDAGGKTGPDLTHFGGRKTIAAGTLVNTPANLLTWISDPQGVKPGANMPKVPLSDNERGALVAYLEALK